ncbi:hypothetical protein Droror1_Dr00005251 [Drosera rotundifolia]
MQSYWRIEMSGARMFYILQKLKGLKRKFKQMHRKSSQISERVPAAEKELLIYQGLLTSQFSDGMKCKTDAALRAYKELVIAEAVYLKHSKEIRILGPQNKKSERRRTLHTFF